MRFVAGGVKRREGSAWLISSACSRPLTSVGENSGEQTSKSPVIEYRGGPFWTN